MEGGARKAKPQDRKFLSEKQQRNSRAGRTEEAGALPQGPGRRGPPLLPFLSPFRPDMVILPALGGFFFPFSVRYFSTFLYRLLKSSAFVLY